MSRVGWASRLPYFASRGIHRASSEVHSQADVHRVRRRMRRTAGGTPTLPEARHPAPSCVRIILKDGINRSSPRSDGVKVLQQLFPFEREDALGVELHAVDRKFAVAQAHDFLLL